MSSLPMPKAPPVVPTPEGARPVRAVVLLDREDRVPRKGESYMKEFRKLSLEPIALPRGRGTLSLRAVEIPGRQVMDVRALMR